MIATFGPSTNIYAWDSGRTRYRDPDRSKNATKLTDAVVKTTAVRAFPVAMHHR
jgi:hypothetical protein